MFRARAQELRPPITPCDVFPFGYRSYFPEPCTNFVASVIFGLGSACMVRKFSLSGGAAPLVFPFKNYIRKTSSVISQRERRFVNFQSSEFIRAYKKEAVVVLGRVGSAFRVLLIDNTVFKAKKKLTTANRLSCPIKCKESTNGTTLCTTPGTGGRVCGGGQGGQVESRRKREDFLLLPSTQSQLF